MTVFKTLLAIITLGLAAAAGFAVNAWHSPIDPVFPPKAGTFDPELLRHGAGLAEIANCNSCHTAPGGRVFAGGRAFATPFGTIYSPNISPDPETGIGLWSEDAFRRALAEGVDRQGRHLYPVFPYDHFTRLTREDVHALYAYFITREPVRAKAPANELRFPLNFRFVVAGWKLLFFRQGPYRPDAGQSEQWNRGAYLVEAAAHCGACHTPRNSLGAEKAGERFSGGEIEGWSAYALNAASPAPVRWTAESLHAYLRNGWQRAHGAALGPMAEVIDNLESVPDDDLGAIATYVASVAGWTNAEPRRAEKPVTLALTESAAAATPREGDAPGGEIFQATCAGCHESGRPLPYGGVPLDKSTGPSAATPTNVINIVLWGVPPAEGKRSPIMPAFADSLDDRQLTALLAYVRAHFSDKPAWADLERSIRTARNGPPMAYPAHGIDTGEPAAQQGEEP
ncbi:MAG TPA: cytochrome c [Xanthobacteraceae bacterium]|nr:cytochrome c [Xanthobacteraceae bacterium]